ncbi:hypothetical protein B0H13DRAFT_1850773 [Mycena leptocephala]|nr:hypothetical protein B0H13DRAFT_1850773 [Mycena leptocephala]
MPKFDATNTRTTPREDRPPLGDIDQTWLSRPHTRRGLKGFIPDERNIIPGKRKRTASTRAAASAVSSRPSKKVLPASLSTEQQMPTTCKFTINYNSTPTTLAKKIQTVWEH